MTVAAVINHVGLTVTNVDEAVIFYRDILGYRLLVPPMTVSPDDSHFGRMARDLLGLRLKSGRFAHMVSDNAIGLELFEFDDPESGPRSEMEFWKNGYFHICITVSDIEDMVAKVVAAGGKQRTEIWEILPGAPYKLAYVDDPFGNPIEIYTASYEETWSAIAASA